VAAAACPWKPVAIGSRSATPAIGKKTRRVMSTLISRNVCDLQPSRRKKSPRLAGLCKSTDDAARRFRWRRRSEPRLKGAPGVAYWRPAYSQWRGWGHVLGLFALVGIGAPRCFADVDRARGEAGLNNSPNALN